MNLTLTERYLVGFHDADPGVTSRVFAHQAVSGAEESFASTYHALLAALPDTGTPITVLDLACGDGHLLGLLAATSAAGHTLIGVDLSHGELAAAQKRLGAQATLYRAKAQQLPLASGTVDAVVSHLALMLMDDADAVLAEMRRVLRLDGTLAGVVGARPTPSAAADAFMRLYPQAGLRPELVGIRFGDRRLRSRDGVAAWLGPAFGAPTFEELSLVRDATPAQWWEGFSDMYDTDLLTDAARETLRCEYLQALQPLCGASGTLRGEDRYLRFSAKAA